MKKNIIFKAFRNSKKLKIEISNKNKIKCLTEKLI